MPTITDWLMVVITTVYVLATIFICRANIKSAEATREQVAESKREFDEENKAYITYELVLERWTLYGMRFTNHGKRVASHVQIIFKKSFIDSLIKTQFVEALSHLHEKECVIGVGQSIDVYFGEMEFRTNKEKFPIEGEIRYKDSKAEYRETFCIDFNKYSSVFSVDENMEDIRQEIEKQTEEIKRISHELHIFNEDRKKEREDA